MAILIPNIPSLLQLPAYFAWPSAIVILATLPIILYAIYNLTLHPLHVVPGPKLWAATQIPYTLAWLSGHLPKLVHALHEQHGDVVRVAPNRLSFTHPDAYHAVRGHRKSGQGEHGKEPSFYFISTKNILGASRDDHTRYRRALAHGFSAKTMQDQQPLITRYVDLLMQRLQEKTTLDSTGAKGTKLSAAGRKEAVVNLAAWFNYTTFDVIGDLAFGEPFGCLEESQYHPWVEAILLGVEQFGVMISLQWYWPGLLGLVKKLVPGGYIGRHTDMQAEYSRQRIARRLALDTERPDFVEAMAAAKASDGRTLTMEEMCSNARMLVIAGSETTATALAGAAYFLAKHPEVQRKLAQEVRSSFTSETEIDFFSVNKLGYLLAVLDESMRMFPPVPNQLPRKSQVDDVISGYHVPGGTAFDIFPWAMSYSSRNFAFAQDFIPERWLDGSKQHFGKSRQGALQPFSVGPRNCIGKNLAYVEMRLILTRLIWNYNLAFGDDEAKEFLDCRSFNLWMKRPLNLRLIPVSV